MTLCLICYEKLKRWEFRDRLCQTCKEQQTLAPFVKPGAPNGAEEPK